MKKTVPIANLPIVDEDMLDAEEGRKLMGIFSDDEKQEIYTEPKGEKKDWVKPSLESEMIELRWSGNDDEGFILQYRTQKCDIWSKWVDAQVIIEPGSLAVPILAKPNPPYVCSCSDCGRKSWTDDSGTRCGMTQPDGQICKGCMLMPIKPKTLEEYIYLCSNCGFRSMLECSRPTRFIACYRCSETAILEDTGSKSLEPKPIEPMTFEQYLMKRPYDSHTLNYAPTKRVFYIYPNGGGKEAWFDSETLKEIK